MYIFHFNVFDQQLGARYSTFLILSCRFSRILKFCMYLFNTEKICRIFAQVGIITDTDHNRIVITIIFISFVM